MSTSPSADRTGETARRATVASLRAALGGVPAMAGGPAAGAPAPMPLGVGEADRMLGGGWPLAALAELRTEAARDAGAAAGFAVALAVRLGAAPRRPLLWIAPAHAMREAGYPYLPGLARFGLDPGALVVVRTRRVEDAVWAGEEAARSGACALTLIEVPGNPAILGLEGTRRLHLRAGASGRPVVLLRAGAQPQTTAAPLRLLLGSGPAGAVPGLADPRLLGAPRWRLVPEKARGPGSRSVTLEWDCHDLVFRSAPDAPLPGRAPAEAADRPDPPRAARPVVALGDAPARRRRAAG